MPDLKAVDEGFDARGTKIADAHSHRHRQKNPQREVAVEEREASRCRRLVYEVHLKKYWRGLIPASIASFNPKLGSPRERKSSDSPDLVEFFLESAACSMYRRAG